MRLYEMSAEFAALFDGLDSISAWEPTIVDGIAVDDDGVVIEDVAEYKDKWIADQLDKLMEMEADFEVKAENIACFIKELSGEAETLRKEKKSVSSRLDAKTHLIDISWANMNRPDLLKYTPEINRTAVKTALQNGDKIQGAVLGRTVSAIIK